MRAAWDWALPRETPAQRRELAEFAADLGFDALVVHDPSATLVERGAALGVDVIAVVTPYPDDDFRAAHPDALQAMRPAEEEAAEALADAPEEYDRLAHRWYPLFRRQDVVCFDHPAARSWLADRVADALEVARGVALDGFGYRNQHACFCDRCRARRADLAAATADPEPAVLARDAERALVEVSETCYEAAKGVDGDAVVTNHVWPPFRPNPTYGHRLRLDYCAQTVAWFYRPAWSLRQVEFEAAERARLADPARNRFVPFVGLLDDDYHGRDPDRVRRELEVALEHGDGNLVFCTLGAPRADPEVRAAVRAALDAA